MPSNDSENDETESTDILSSIINGCPFKIKPDEEKLAILKKGRPLPKLEIVKRDSAKNCNRTFQESWYSVHKWLCGSTIFNKLFCWPCTLMRPESSSWCSIGNDDMKRLSSIASKHSKCHMHLKAITEYDAMLVSFGLPAEYVNETNFGCKEEQEQQPESDSEEDYFNLYFGEENKAKKIKTETESTTAKTKASTNETKKNDIQSSASKGQISFKAWQELNKSNFPVSSSNFLEGRKLFKWKRKIAKQELRNARLAGHKLEIEIELMKTKLVYYKSLNADSSNIVDKQKEATIFIPLPTGQPTNAETL